MFAAVVLIGLLVLSPFEAAETEGNVNKTRSRQPRHWGNLFHMTAAATGRNPQDFVFYGRYCGFGKVGETRHPVDKIDECCRYHDACYDLAKREPCKEKAITEEDVAYVQSYKWNFHVADMFIECEDYGDQCKTTLCECDATLVGCFKYHLDSYNTSNVRGVTGEELFKMVGFHYREEARKQNEPKEE